MQASLAIKAPLKHGNLLLDALPTAEHRRLRPHLEFVALASGKVLFEAHARPTHGYFPTTGLVSVVTAVAGHSGGEVAVTGSEGMIGVSLLLEGEGASGPPSSAVVQSAGYAYRLPAEILAREFFCGVELQQVLLCYTQALLTQIAQTAACARHHRLAEQLCRWLLLRLDRSAGCDIFVTQGQIAKMLGVRREGVTEAARGLQRAGAIHYARGRITVLDRSRLECRACECYAVIRREYARLMAQRNRRDCGGMTVSAA